MKTIPNITVTLRCKECGHEQSVNSTTAHEDDEGKPHYYFGSAYDFCDRCDGAMEIIEDEA